jgi:hypothetical protein
MATKLELVQKLAKQARIGSLPTTTVNQSGEFLMCVDYIEQAYSDIQRKAGGLWKFLRNDFSFNTVASTANYTATTVGVSLKKWIEGSFRVYLTSTGVSDEQHMIFVPWDNFRDIYVKGLDRTNEGRPTYFSIKPDKSIQLYPVPDAQYTVVGEYYATPDVFDADDDDEPIFPDSFHDILVWKGLEYYGAEYNKPNREIFGKQQFTAMYNEMRFDQIDVSWGAPLA